MKKREWKEIARRAQIRASSMTGQIGRLQAEVAEMRRTWRPIPIAHEWQPRDPQCALCDEPRDAERHRAVDHSPVGTSPSGREDRVTIC